MALAKTPSLRSQPPKNGSSRVDALLFSLCALLQQLFSSSARCSFDTERKEAYLFCCKFLANTAERERAYLSFLCCDRVKEHWHNPSRTIFERGLSAFYSLTTDDTNFCQLQKLQSRFEFWISMILNFASQNWAASSNYFYSYLPFV